MCEICDTLSSNAAAFALVYCEDKITMQDHQVQEQALPLQPPKSHAPPLMPADL